MGTEIERFAPMRVHKGMVIRALRLMTTEEEVRAAMPDYGSADEAIAALEAHPGEWIVGGLLLTFEELAKLDSEST